MKILKIGFWGNFAFFLLELAGGLWSGSLALLSDAAHLAGDTITMRIAWWAEDFAKRPAGGYSYGRERVKALASVVIVTFLSTLVVTVILPEAVGRFRQPKPILELPMIIIAFVGLLWNGWLRKRLGGAHKHEYHIHGAKLHVDLDFLSSIGVVAAAGLIWWTGYTWFDPLASILVIGVIMWGGIRTLLNASTELLDLVPPFDWSGLDYALRQIQGVQNWHHSHLRRIGGKYSMTLHVEIVESANGRKVGKAVRRVLARREVECSTVQIDTGPCLQATCIFQNH